MPIYAVVVTAGKEEYVADIIYNVAKRSKLELYSVMAIPQLKGFVFVEAPNNLEVQRAILGIRYAKRVLPEEIPIDELKRYFEEEKIEVNVGDIVEIIVGGFKGARAKVVKIDNKKQELLVELLDVPVPLNISIPINNVKVVEKSSK